MFTKDSLLSLLQDRTLIIMTIISVLVALVLIISVAVNIRATDVQVPVRCTSYGINAFNEQCYTEQWYYLLNFIAIGLILLAQPLITIKMLAVKGRTFAVAFAAGTILVGVIGTLLTLIGVLRTASITL